MNIMKDYNDNHFDLAVVDPPYGIGVTKMQLGNGKRKIYRGASEWDLKPPDKLFFNELFRISKNQIIFNQIYKNGQCAIIMFDVSERRTYNSVDKYYK